MDLRADLAGQSVSFGAWTTLTGAPVTITSATTGLSLWYRRGTAGAKVAISPSDLALITSAYSAGGIKVIEGPEHRLDLPDAAIATGVLTIEWGGTATGITIDGGTANLIGQENSSPALAVVDSVLTIPAALKAINATSIAGTGTHVAAAFLAQYNVATPVFTNASVNQTVDFGSTIVDGKTGPESLAIIGAVVAGKVSGVGTGEETFVGLDGATTRAVVEVTETGNRTGVTY